jgi:steroid delta-isomerase-like uncharacterized protein
MSTQDNKALARRWLEEVWNQGDLSLVDELIAPTYVLHDPTRPGLRGWTGIRESVAMFRTASPDLHFTIEDQIAEGDQVVTRYTIQGTHQGPLLGIAATGKQATLTGIDLYRIAESKIEEAWSNWDTLGMWQQLGVVPTPGQVSSSLALASGSEKMET